MEAAGFSDSPESRVVGGPIQSAAVAGLVRSYNPISHISAGADLPPFLIVHGDSDELVPFNQSVLLYEALREAGQGVEFYKVRGGGHGPGIFSRDMMDIVIEFLDRKLGAP